MNIMVAAPLAGAPVPCPKLRQTTSFKYDTLASVGNSKVSSEPAPYGTALRARGLGR